MAQLVQSQVKEKTNYTPSSISASKLEFCIPLYQRLFEWEPEQIRQLLNDLYTSFKGSLANPKPYYIGTLTTYEENSKFSLVDGQQRFTVLTLMAIAFDDEKWNKFLQTGNHTRLSFFARKSDSQYLERKIQKLENLNYLNKKMEAGISVIKNFPNSEGPSEAFINYIYNHATFFISKLPQNYGPQDLNRYFEAMNSLGRSLENHEILKVKLLKEVDGNKRDYYTRIWNSVSEMDKCLIRQKTGDKDKENVDTFRSRINAALSAVRENSSPEEIFKHCNSSPKQADSNENKSIKVISQSNQQPKKVLSSHSEGSILSFSEFLLQVLWMQMGGEERKLSNDFFNVHKLQHTFKTNLDSGKTSLFLNNLLRFRILFDHYILKINYNEQNISSYKLNFGAGGENEPEQTKLIQFQSMLLVSTSYHIWLEPAFRYLNHNVLSFCLEDFLNELKVFDNNRHNVANLKLCYGKVDRYWFWRLDYYLWENRDSIYNGKEKELAEKYVFKTNRSIEHIAPQKPKHESKIEIEGDLLHSFGNLAMISSGQNSSLQNESFEVKQAFISSFINEKSSSLQSLKMLEIYKFQSWDKGSIALHSDKMIKVLIDSFKTDSESYSDVIEALESKLVNEKIEPVG